MKNHFLLFVVMLAALLAVSFSSPHKKNWCSYTFLIFSRYSNLHMYQQNECTIPQDTTLYFYNLDYTKNDSVKIEYSWSGATQGCVLRDYALYKNDNKIDTFSSVQSSVGYNRSIKEEGKYDLYINTDVVSSCRMRRHIRFYVTYKNTIDTEPIPTESEEIRSYLNGQGYLLLETGQNIIQGKLRLSDMTGRIIWEENIEKVISAWQSAHSLQHLATGVYVWTLIYPEKPFISQKIIKH